MKGQINQLSLLYPPISNQEGEWLSKVPAVRLLVERSKLYMIGLRPELLFDDLRVDQEAETLHFDLTMLGTDQTLEIALPMSTLLPDYVGQTDIEFGPKFIRISKPHRAPEEEPLTWFTPDKLLYDASNRHYTVITNEAPRGFTSFELLYVGISKTGDSFSRLFDTGHQGRLRILSNERQRSPQSRVTDEMTLFLFDIDRLGIVVHTDESVAADFGSDFMGSIEQVAADAEKAFVKLLDPKYNEVKYLSYPRGKDGLFGTGLTRYAYAIREDLTFHTPAGEIRGSTVENEYDVILVEGELVAVHRPS